MKSAKDVKLETTFWKGIVTGDYGTGKSSFAASFPTPGFVFDFDEGIELYRGKDFDYETFERSPKGWVEFTKVQKEIAALAAGGKYKTIILDSTTSMGDIAMARALQLDPNRSNEGGPVWNIHYSIQRNLMEPRLREFTTYPANVVVICHLKLDKDEKTGSIIAVNPLLVGQLAEKVPGYFGEVYLTFAKRTKDGKTEYVVRTQPRGLYKARSRLSGLQRILPEEFPNDYNVMMNYIKDAAIAEEKEK